MLHQVEIKSTDHGLPVVLSGPTGKPKAKAFLVDRQRTAGAPHAKGKRSSEPILPSISLRAVHEGRRPVPNGLDNPCKRSERCPPRNFSGSSARSWTGWDYERRGGEISARSGLTSWSSRSARDGRGAKSP